MPRQCSHPAASVVVVVAVVVAGRRHQRHCRPTPQHDVERVVSAPRLWLIARRNSRVEYAPASHRSMRALIRASFRMLRFFFGRRICRVLLCHFGHAAYSHVVDRCVLQIRQGREQVRMTDLNSSAESHDSYLICC